MYTHTHTHTHTHRGEPVRVVVVVPFSPCRAKERQRAACTRVTITISLLSRGPCIYRPIQRKYGEYDHKVLGPLGSGEIACTICSCAYHKRGGSSYVIAVSRLSLFLPPPRGSSANSLPFQLINTPFGCPPVCVFERPPSRESSTNFFSFSSSFPLVFLHSSH